MSSGGRTAEEISRQILLKLYPGALSTAEASDAFLRDHSSIATFETVLDAVGSTPRQQKSLVVPFFENMEPSSGFTSLALLILYGYFNPIVLTTNFDTMLEDSIRTAIIRWKWDREVRVLVQEDVTSDFERYENEILVVKLHGDLRRPDQPLHIAVRDTARLLPSAKTLVTSLFREAGIVMVGYRIKDIGIRNVLEEVEQSEGSLCCIVPDPSVSNDPESALLLERHGLKSARVVECTFDDFFEALGGGLTELAQRRVIGQRLDAAWGQLEEACLFGSKRREILDSLLAESFSLVDEAMSCEAQALLECVSYQRHPRGEWYRLEHGVALLEQSNDAFEKFRRMVGVMDTIVPQFALLTLMRDLFLVGTTDAEERQRYINKVMMRAESLRERVAGHEILLARCLVVSAEAAKEKAMVTPRLTESRVHFMASRQYCEAALAMIEKSNDESVSLWRATCRRHLAISFEQEANASADPLTRQRLYRKWSEISSAAVAEFSSIGEDAMRSYALMNRASSLTRLSTFTEIPEQKREMLRLGEIDLVAAIEASGRVEDSRGLVWAYVHLCENLRGQIQLGAVDPELHVKSARIAARLEESAAAAVSHSRLTGDQLATALAKRELGNALSLPDALTSDVSALRTERAIQLLWESASALEHVGYYRGAGHAYSNLAEVLGHQWEESGDVSLLLDGNRALVAAIVSMGEAFGASDRLARLFDLLRRELASFLDE